MKTTNNQLQAARANYTMGRLQGLQSHIDDLKAFYPEVDFKRLEFALLATYNRVQAVKESRKLSKEHQHAKT